MLFVARLLIELPIHLTCAAIPEDRVARLTFHNLNNDSVDVSSTWKKLNTTSGTHSFSKKRDDTNLEVYVNSRFSVGKFAGTKGVQFQARVDKKMPGVGNTGSITKPNTQEFLSILAVFRKLPSGKHTVSIWGQAAQAGSATSVTVDPGGWGGKIIVKETD
jgi:hypothetical protein